MQTRAAAGALLLLAAIGRAQPARQNWDSVKTLADGAEVRLTLTTGKDVRGFFQNATPEAIVLNAATSQEMLGRKEVKRVQLKKAGHRGRNTLIGLAVGAGGGLAAGIAADAKADDSWFPSAGKAVLTPLGAILGTIIGVVWPTGGWRDIYRAP